MKPLKSIWKRRNRYGWLIAEIIVASAIAFFVLDPIVVSIYDAHRPYNYDVDRLVMVQVHQLDSYDPAFNPERDNLDAMESDLLQIVPKFAALPEVEKAIPLPSRGFGGGEDSDDVIWTTDSVAISAFKATFIPETEFFTTMGMKAAADIPGNPSIEEMNNMWVNYYDEMICTRTEARLLHGDEYTAMAKSLETYENADRLHKREVTELKIVGIIEDTRAWGDRPLPLIRFYADPLSHSFRWNRTRIYNVLLRLKKGESTKAFAHRINSDPELQELARVGMMEFNNAQAYSEFNQSDSILSPKERYRNVLVIFFAINIFLGVFGTFWLLTRKRTEEAGVMRAFGASPRYVRMMLYAEGAAIAIFSSLIGCAIYIFYLYKNPEMFEYGLNTYLKGIDMNVLPADLHTWVGDFWAHSAIVTAVVCSLMLIVVLAGIAIPAWKLSRIHPVEALADE